MTEITATITVPIDRVQEVYDLLQRPPKADVVFYTPGGAVYVGQMVEVEKVGSHGVTRFRGKLVSETPTKVTIDDYGRQRQFNPRHVSVKAI